MSCCFGKQPKIKNSIKSQENTPSFSQIDLSKPFDPQGDKPSETDTQTQDDALANYGTLIHKIFEIIKPDQQQDHHELKSAVELSLNANIHSHDFESALKEVTNCLQSTQLSEIFKQTQGREILKEVSISFIQNDKIYNRVLDHLIIEETTAWIIDYKTTRDVSLDTMQARANEYLDQIKSYCNAVSMLYPEKTIRASILFTSIPALYDFNLY